MGVYFLQPVGGGPIKIGHSKHPLTRLQDVMRWSPTPLEVLAEIEGTMALERWLHRKLAAYRMHFEWFRPQAPVLEVVQQAIAGEIVGAPRHLRCSVHGYRFDLGRFLRALGVTAKQLAEEIGVSAQTLHMRARHYFDTSILELLAHAAKQHGLQEPIAAFVIPPPGHGPLLVEAA
jgi:hypothetical protein